MGTYRQNSVYVSGADLLGSAVPWYNNVGPTQILTLASPIGPGDELVRSELYLQMGYFTFATSTSANTEVIPYVNTVAALEVYSVGVGGFPDPRLGTQRAQNRVAFPCPGGVYLDHNGVQYVQATGSTNGYVVSKGKRSPNQYGVGHPEARVGLWTEGIGDSWLLHGNGQGTWVWHLSCIWFTP